MNASRKKKNLAQTQRSPSTQLLRLQQRKSSSTDSSVAEFNTQRSKHKHHRALSRRKSDTSNLSPSVTQDLSSWDETSSTIRHRANGFGQKSSGATHARTWDTVDLAVPTTPFNASTYLPHTVSQSQIVTAVKEPKWYKGIKTKQKKPSAKDAGLATLQWHPQNAALFEPKPHALLLKCRFPRLVPELWHDRKLSFVPESVSEHSPFVPCITSCKKSARGQQTPQTISENAPSDQFAITMEQQTSQMDPVHIHSRQYAGTSGESTQQPPFQMNSAQTPPQVQYASNSRELVDQQSPHMDSFQEIYADQAYQDKIDRQALYYSNQPRQSQISLKRQRYPPSDRVGKVQPWNFTYFQQPKIAPPVVEVVEWTVEEDEPVAETRNRSSKLLKCMACLAVLIMLILILSIIALNVKQYGYTLFGE